MSTVHYFLVEGETEEHFVSAFVRIGRVMIFNMWEESAEKRIIRKLRPSKSEFYIFYDTDVERSEIEYTRFLGNFNKLKMFGSNIIFLQQTGNLEDELCRALALKNTKLLFLLFKASGAGEFKKRFVAESDLKNKLKRQISFNPHKMFCQEIIDMLKQPRFADIRSRKGSYASISHLMDTLA